MQTFTRWNPPTVKSTMAPAKVVREVYDFSRDENHNLIVVKSGTKNFDEMAAVAAEGCDFRTIHEALRSGNISLSRAAFENPTGKRYGDTTGEPTDLVDLDQTYKKMAAEILESYEKLPADLRGNMTISQFSEFVKNGGIKGYAESKAPIQSQQEVNDNAGQ